MGDLSAKPGAPKPWKGTKSFQNMGGPITLYGESDNLKWGSDNINWGSDNLGGGPII